MSEERTGMRLSVFKRRLNDLMREQKIKAPTLAEKSGVNIRSLQKYQDSYNQSIPSSTSVYALAEALNVSIDYLLGKDNVRHFGNKEIHEAIGLSESSIEVLREFAAGGYSRVNIWMINYILEHYRDTGADHQITILWSLWSYIHAADLVYLGNVKDNVSDIEVGYEITKKGTLAADPEDRVTFFDKGWNSIFRLGEPERLYQSSVMESIQAYLREQAEAYKQKRDKEGCSPADDLLFQSVKEFVEEAEASSKSRKGSETGSAPDDKQIKQKKGRK